MLQVLYIKHLPLMHHHPDRLGRQTIPHCSRVGPIIVDFHIQADLQGLLTIHSIALLVVQPSIPTITSLHGSSSTNYHNSASFIDATSNVNASTISFQYGLSTRKSSFASTTSMSTSHYSHTGCTSCTCPRHLKC